MQSPIHKDMEKLHTSKGDFVLIEKVPYKNGGSSLFYEHDQMMIIVDRDICRMEDESRFFAYRDLTIKQNECMAKYEKVYRILEEDIDRLESVLQMSETDAEVSTRQSDRADLGDATPLEMSFEDSFTEVYGKDSTKYLWKEYGITDSQGHTKFFDYYVSTKNGDIAVEENGVHYHHPQLIGIEKYREQLRKQNLCVNNGAKIYRFSSEDCAFKDQIEDDIKTYFGTDASAFKERGLWVNRPVVLYDHQVATLEEMQAQRNQGVRSFLIVFPTASGKSKIVEEDIQAFAAQKSERQNLNDTRIVILVPNTTIKEDWEQRVDVSLSSLKQQILICTYAYMERHFTEYSSDYFQYMVVDEAHHAVAPGLKRTIQYFHPEFLVGITATDERPDKQRLETIFGSYQVGLSLQEAMEKGIIARANAFRIRR